MQVDSTFADAIGTALLARFIWLLGGFMLSGVFGVYIHDRRKFAGRWKMHIVWSPDHTQALFGTPQDDAFSTGFLAISHGRGVDKKGYSGMGFFELRSGTDTYAKLCVELTDMVVKRRWFSKIWPFLFRARLEELRLESLIRQKMLEFTYGPWARYKMLFHNASGTRLSGVMVLEASGKEVGKVTATREY